MAIANRLNRRYRSLIVVICFTLISYYCGFSTILNPHQTDDDQRANDLFLQSPESIPPKEGVNPIIWTADTRWDAPFSFTITRNLDTILIPISDPRPPIYTYYDTNNEKSQQILKQKEVLLTQWKKSWWAQGFKPVVIGPEKAESHSQYDRIESLGLKQDLKYDMLKLLAWSSSGGGILADPMLFPMAAYDHDLLSFLRAQSYTSFERYQGLHSALFTGNATEIDQAISKFISHESVKQAAALIGSVFDDSIAISSLEGGVAWYSTDVLSGSYPVVYLATTELEQLISLSQLIDYHLRTIWRSNITSVSAIKPIAKYSTIITTPALHLAFNLTACPPYDALILSSCPPNVAHCKQCLSSIPISVATPNSFRNRTGHFFIGTIAHPLTSSTLLLDDRTERMYPVLPTLQKLREEEFRARSPFVNALTEDSMKRAFDAQMPLLKNAITGTWARQNAYWLAAETLVPEVRKPDSIDVPAKKENLYSLDESTEATGELNAEDLSWHFGFSVLFPGQDARDASKSETPVPGPERMPVVQEVEGRKIEDEGTLERQRRILAISRAQLILPNSRIVKAIEAWNLGDLEIWNFVRAIRSRDREERTNYENLGMETGKVVDGL